MKKVKMSVNPENLVKSLKLSFTNQATFLGELMQNSRRANATQVVFEFIAETKILQVTDDGCGIDSVETLLTVAESGWDAETIAQEHPFGIGFLSALFACRHITVVSKGGRFSAYTADILAFKPITVAPVTDWDGITTITMIGVELELEKIGDMLDRLAMGFPIPVKFNNEMIDRKYAIDSGLDFINTEVGAVHLAGINDPNITITDFEVYLQGLPIYRSSRFRSLNSHVIHLDSSRFYARLPDRNQLIDENDVVTLINVVLKQELEKHFTLLKSIVSAEEFVRFYGTLKQWNLLSLLNDVPVVPNEVIYIFNDYPVCDTDTHGDFMSNPGKALSKLEIEAREVVSCIDHFNYDMKDDGSAAYMFAWKRESLVYDGGLDGDHWIHSMIRNLNDEELMIELINESHEACFEGEWIGVNVRFCDSYRINIGNDVVEFTDDAFYQGYSKGGAAIVPKGDVSGNVLNQISDYRNESDEYQESTHESDDDAFISFVVANITTDPVEAMSHMLPGFTGCPSLFGKSFVVTLNEKGNVASVMAA